MKQKDYSSLGIKFKLAVPESVEEFDSLAKAAGGCLTEATNNVVYRGVLADFRNTFLHGREADATNGLSAIEGIEQTTGIERKTKPVLKDDGSPVLKDGDAVVEYDETEGVFFKRVCAQLKFEAEHFAKQAQAVADQMVFDPSAQERKAPGPKKLAAQYKEAAERIISNGNFEKQSEKLSKILGVAPLVLVNTGDAVADTAKNAENLGWLVKSWSDAEAKKKMVALS